MTYYAVCNVNGPISVELEGSNEDKAFVYFEKKIAPNSRYYIDNAYTDIEDDLDIDGYGMSESRFDKALTRAGAIPIESLDTITGRDRMYHRDGGWFLWAVK